MRGFNLFHRNRPPHKVCSCICLLYMYPHHLFVIYTRKHRHACVRAHSSHHTDKHAHTRMHIHACTCTHQKKSVEWVRTVITGPIGPPLTASACSSRGLGTWARTHARTQTKLGGILGILITFSVSSFICYQDKNAIRKTIIFLVRIWIPFIYTSNSINRTWLFVFVKRSGAGWECGHASRLVRANTHTHMFPHTHIHSHNTLYA